MARVFITARIESETKEFFEGEYAKDNKVKGRGRALDCAAKELKAIKAAKKAAPSKK